MNIIIPMAGSGTRFNKAGFENPKPFIEFNNKTMIEHVVNSINVLVDNNITFICQVSHLNSDRREILRKLSDKPIIEIDYITGGASQTVLLAEKYITEDELLIVNSDQIVNADFISTLQDWRNKGADGGIFLFIAEDSKWSYVRCDINLKVSEVAEKRVISNFATCGIYWFRNGLEYVKYTEQMIEKNVKTNGEFYVCPVFNEFIQDGKCIYGSMVNNMHGIGTPEDLEIYKNSLKNDKT